MTPKKENEESFERRDKYSSSPSPDTERKKHFAIPNIQTKPSMNLRSSSLPKERQTSDVVLEVLVPTAHPRKVSRNASQMYVSPQRVLRLSGLLTYKNISKPTLSESKVKLQVQEEHPKKQNTVSNLSFFNDRDLKGLFSMSGFKNVFIRKDRKGNAILRGGKKHHITFRDKVSIAG